MQAPRTGIPLLLVAAVALLGAVERVTGFGEARSWAYGIEQGADALSELTPVPGASAEEEDGTDSLLAPAVTMALPRTLRRIPPGDGDYASSVATCGTHWVRGPPLHA